MKLWLKFKNGSMLGVVWKAHPGPILATVRRWGTTERNVYFHNVGELKGHPIYEEQE